MAIAFSGDYAFSGLPYMPPWAARAVYLRGASIGTEWAAQSINVTSANAVAFPARYISLTGPITLDQAIGEWRNGEWFVRLISQSIAGRPDAFRVCWLSYLPDQEIRPIGPPEVETIPAGPPINRLQCSEHRRSDGKRYRRVFSGRFRRNDQDVYRYVVRGSKQQAPKGLLLHQPWVGCAGCAG